MAHNYCLCQLPLLESRLVDGQKIFICQQEISKKCNYILYQQENENERDPFGLIGYDSNQDSNYNEEELSESDESISDISSLDNVSQDELNDIQHEVNEIIENN